MNAPVKQAANEPTASRTSCEIRQESCSSAADSLPASASPAVSPPVLTAAIRTKASIYSSSKSGTELVPGTASNVLLLPYKRSESTTVEVKKKRVIEGPVLKEVDKALPGALHQARKLLHIFAKANGIHDLARYPREHHICLQVNLMALEFSRAIKQNDLTYICVRESFENLWYLMEYCKPTSTRDSTVTARLARKLVLIMERVSSALEDFSGEYSTNWVKVAELFHNEAKTYTQDTPPYKAAKFKYFTMNRMLGSGGFGTIYKAHLAGVVCTVKLIPLELLNEAKHACMDKLVASMINSPFLVKYFACFLTRQAFVTAMEYIRGCDLGKLLKVARAIPEDVLRLIIAQLGEALEHMHMKGFIHRDVKPANLLMTVGCRVKLIDFDTAKTCIGKFVKKSQLSFSQRTPAEFFDSQIAGTIPYLAPECVTYTGYGRAMDWWATGVTTFHLATGRLPFQRFRTQEELQRMIAAGFYRWPKDKVISQELQEFVNALMQKKPHDRLCSRRYSDFHAHPFLSGVEWQRLPSVECLMEYPVIKKCMGKTLTGYSPIGSGASDPRRFNLSPANIVDTNEHSNLYTFCSAGFIRVINELNSGRVPTIDTIMDPYDTSDDPEPDYIFERFLII